MRVLVVSDIYGDDVRVYFSIFYSIIT